MRVVPAPKRPRPPAPPTGSFRVVRTRRGARLVQDGLVLSEIAAAPGPTDSLFDVLAAAVAALAPGPRVGLLGFAGGGLVAPLRAMGFGHPLLAVDLSLAGHRLFRELSGPWAGQVEVQEADALAWLARQRRPFDLLLEDLSVATSAGVTKPGVSLGPLPALVCRRLAPRGVAVTNVLPVPGLPWREVEARILDGHAHALRILPLEYENRILVAGRALETAAVVSRRLRRFLAAIGSDQARRIRVQRVR
jgi:hypothetical protein